MAAVSSLLSSLFSTARIIIIFTLRKASASDSSRGGRPRTPVWFWPTLTSHILLIMLAANSYLIIIIMI